MDRHAVTADADVPLLQGDPLGLLEDNALDVLIGLDCIITLSPTTESG